MKFVDEAVIQAVAGKGGDGCLSFLRAKYVPRGGPNGGDGGSGGSIFLKANASLNTLIDFRYQRLHRAINGQQGMGQNCSGKGGDDMIIAVPIGTMVYDSETEELIGDLTEENQMLLVCKGGRGGLGNTHFKSSVNRTPRQITKGALGEKRMLRLELKVLADVGLLGMPNAGKSMLIRSVSSARPRVADYPFTTLYPNLGVVRVGPLRSFVMADIPGLLEGAAEGTGLGIQFLKHLMRTHILLHVVDIAAVDGHVPAQAAQAIIKELEKFSADLAIKPRWLVLNKIDLLQPDEVEQRTQEVISALNWDGPVFKISALSKQGTELLCQKLMDYIDQQNKKGKEEEDKDNDMERFADI